MLNVTTASTLLVYFFISVTEVGELIHSKSCEFA